MFAKRNRLSNQKFLNACYRVFKVKHLQKHNTRGTVMETECSSVFSDKVFVRNLAVKLMKINEGFSYVTDV